MTPRLPIVRERVDDGRRSPVRAEHVNRYIRRHTGVEASAKDLRTWGGTRVAASLLLQVPEAELADERMRQRALTGIVREVAERLGNTPAVARESYIDPRVLRAAEHPERLERVRERLPRMRARKHRGVDEQAAISLIG